MCSLLLIADKKGSISDLAGYGKRFLQMNKKRGPDMSGSEVLNHVFLGSNRLRIIGENEEGKMPMKSTERNVYIVFNGEIYNYEEVRQTLIEKGRTFKTSTDTEVILEAYLHYGESFTSFLNGIFSIAIYDGERGIVLLTRDRFGAKPLYYFNDQSLLMADSGFLSLCEAISEKHKMKVDAEALDALVFLRFVPGDKTIFSGIHKVLPAEQIVFNLANGEVQKNIYWKATLGIQKYFQEDFNTHLEKAINLTAKSDVEFGVLLSGGLDSSLVTAKLAEENLQSFSASFKDAVDITKKSELDFSSITNGNLDESFYSKKVSDLFKTKHNHLALDYDFSSQKAIEFMTALEEPMASPNALGAFLMAEQIKDSVQLKLLLSGTGADELLGGYLDLYFSNRTSMENASAEHLLKSFANFDSPIDTRKYLKNAQGTNSYLQSYLDTVMKPFSSLEKKEEVLNQIMIFELGFGLPFWELEQADKLFMHFSMELRSSFLENDFLNYCLSISSVDKKDKKPLRIAGKGLLPDDVLERRKIPSLSTPEAIEKTSWFKEWKEDLEKRPLKIWSFAISELQSSVKELDVVYRLAYIQAWFKNIGIRYIDGEL